MKSSIRGYEGLYSIDTDGVVYRDSAVMAASRRHPNGFTRPERKLRPSVQTNGYLIVSLSNGPRKRTKQIHKLVAETFLHKPEGAQCVNHIDEDKTNNTSANLEWVTYQYNSAYSNARYYNFHKDGVKYVIFNLHQYCIQNKLHDSCMRKVLEGTQPEHRGYTL
mgnify:CR=1 FL=1